MRNVIDVMVSIVIVGVIISMGVKSLYYVHDRHELKSTLHDISALYKEASHINKYNEHPVFLVINNNEISIISNNEIINSKSNEFTINSPINLMMNNVTPYIHSTIHKGDTSIEFTINGFGKVEEL